MKKIYIYLLAATSIMGVSCSEDWLKSESFYIRYYRSGPFNFGGYKGSVKRSLSRNITAQLLRR